MGNYSPNLDENNNIEKRFLCAKRMGTNSLIDPLQPDKLKPVYCGIKRNLIEFRIFRLYFFNYLDFPTLSRIHGELFSSYLFWPPNHSEKFLIIYFFQIINISK